MELEMKKIVIMGLLLSGCTTLGGMDRNDPHLTLHSERSMGAVEMCVGRIYHAFSPQILRGENEVTITMAVDGVVYSGVKIRPLGEGTEIRAWHPKGMRGAIERCAQNQ
jgi:hypothetical protein